MSAKCAKAIAHASRKTVGNANLKEKRKNGLTKKSRSLETERLHVPKKLPNGAVKTKTAGRRRWLGAWALTERQLAKKRLLNGAEKTRPAGKRRWPGA